MEVILDLRQVIKPESSLKSKMPYFLFYKLVLIKLLTKLVRKAFRYKQVKDYGTQSQRCAVHRSTLIKHTFFKNNQTELIRLYFINAGSLLCM